MVESLHSRNWRDIPPGDGSQSSKWTTVGTHPKGSVHPDRLGGWRWGVPRTPDIRSPGPASLCDKQLAVSSRSSSCSDGLHEGPGRSGRDNRDHILSMQGQRSASTGRVQPWGQLRSPSVAAHYKDAYRPGDLKSSAGIRYRSFLPLPFEHACPVHSPRRPRKLRLGASAPPDPSPGRT